MRKALSLVQNDPSLKPYFDTLDTALAHSNQRLEFLKKQAENEREEFSKKENVVWEKVIVECKAQGKLPDDFTKEKYHFHYDTEGSVLYVCDGADHKKHPMKALLDKLGPGTIIGPFDL